MSHAPIVLFVFNRPEHTEKTLDSLRGNVLAAESELFVFCDGPRNESDQANVEAVRTLVDKLEGFKKITVVKKAANQGLAGSVIAGVSQVVKSFGKVIVVEDDLQFSPYFLTYMNECLVRYESDPMVYSIGGWSPPIDPPSTYQGESYLSYRCCTWGWASWSDRWDRVDWNIKDFPVFIKDEARVSEFNRGGDDMSAILKLQMDGKISSWGIRWDYAHFVNQAYCFRPVNSIVGNTGNDGTGVHCGATDKFDVIINKKSRFIFPKAKELKVDDDFNRRFATFYDGRKREENSVRLPLPPVLSSWRKLVSWLR